MVFGRKVARLHWLVAALISGLVLVACSSSAVADPVPAEELLGEGTLSTESSDETEIEESIPEEETDNTARSGRSVDSESEVTTDADVPTSLSRLDWGTDWTRTTIDLGELMSGGVPRDGIRSIDDPSFMSQNEADEWLADTEPVIALALNGEAHAYPLSIMTQHEIVNDRIGDIPVAVTFCPLCNAAVVYDRRVNGEVYEFGVSGLLRNSDLVMYDRTTESLYQQFTGEGIVGENAGIRLTFIPSSLISYRDFKDAYPDGWVLSNERPGRSYGVNPYQFYDQTTGRPFLYTGEIDPRLPTMMRIVGLDLNGETIAYPYETLAEVSVVNDTVGGQAVVIFYKFGTNSALGARVIAEAEDVGAATVFNRTVDGQTLTFTIEDGGFMDEQTGSTWNMLGQAIDGPLAGTELELVKYSNDFWFAWAAFFPETEIYEAD